MSILLTAPSPHTSPSTGRSNREPGLIKEQYSASLSMMCGQTWASGRPTSYLFYCLQHSSNVLTVTPRNPRTSLYTLAEVANKLYKLIETIGLNLSPLVLFALRLFQLKSSVHTYKSRFSDRIDTRHVRFSKIHI